MSAEESAKQLKKAMKGMGTNEGKIIKEICDNNNLKRQDIKMAYIQLYNKRLEEDLESEIGGRFLQGCIALLKRTEEFEAECLFNAMKGLGTKESVLIEILCTKTGYELKILAQAFHKLYEKNLCDAVSGDTSGDFGKYLRLLAAGTRDDSYMVDKKLAHNEATDLYKAGEDRMGTNESKFIRVLSSRNFLQLEETFNVYLEVSGGSDIEQAIQKELSGDFKTALLTTVKSVRNRPLYFAGLLREDMAGFGTKDDRLMRHLITPSHIDLPKIKIEYQKMYGKSLYDAVKSELSGDYEKLFLRLIGQN